MNVDQIMSKPPVVASPDDPVWRLAALFEKHGFHHLPVVEDGRLLGVISDRDVLRHLSPFVGMINERRQDVSTLDRPAHQVMTRRLVTIRASTSATEAAALMLEHRVSCLPVVDHDGQVLGMVTSRDLLRAAYLPND